jgi:hypothetical protein
MYLCPFVFVVPDEASCADRYVKDIMLLSRTSPPVKEYDGTMRQYLKMFAYTVNPTLKKQAF